MKKLLENILAKIDGLHCIIISDRDGIPIMKALTDKAPESVLKAGFLSTFSSQKGSKMGLGVTQSIICFFSSYQVIQTGYESLIITFVASENANTGYMLHTVKNDMLPLLSEISNLFNEGY